MGRTVYYRSLEEDMVTNSGQDHRLEEGYRWMRDGSAIGKAACALSFALIWIVGRIWCLLFLRVRYIGREKIAAYKGQGIFLFSNHTQTVADVFLPAFASRRRIYTIVSPANLGLPVLGPILPYAGAIPVAGDLKGMRAMKDTIGRRLAAGKVVVSFPEAHVWPWCGFIRPFSTAPFHYALDFDVPSFTMCVSYQKRGLVRRRATIVVDGPFTKRPGASGHEAVKELRDKVEASLCEGAKLNSYSYVDYRKEEG